MQTISKLQEQGIIELDCISADVPIIKFKAVDKMPDPDTMQKMNDELLQYQDDWRNGVARPVQVQVEKPGLVKRAWNWVIGK